jgi:hypothetical protein
MELLRPATMLVVTALASAQQAPKPTDRVAWGSAVNGLRIGAAFGSDPSKPTLQVLFQNVGSTVQDVLIGAETGKGSMYNMKFIATAANGGEREGVYVSGFAVVAGVLVPLSVRLNAGETHELEFPLKKIIYAPRYTTTLDDVLNQGYSVRVRFEANQAAADWAKLSSLWIGTVSSAEVSLAH